MHLIIKRKSKDLNETIIFLSVVESNIVFRINQHGVDLLYMNLESITRLAGDKSDCSSATWACSSVALAPADAHRGMHRTLVI